MSFRFRSLLLALPLCMCLPGVLKPADLETWHQFDLVMPVSPRLEWTAGTQLRTWDNLGGVYQGRLMSSLEYAAHARISLVGGYVYRQVRARGGPWVDWHRPYAGVIVPVAGAGKWYVDARMLAERHMGGPLPGYTRYRERLRVRWGRGVVPFTAAEVFENSHGITFTRLQWGVETPAGRTARLEVSYVHEVASGNRSVERHAIMTRLRFRPSAH